MGFTDAVKNDALTTITAEALYVSVHTADPGTTGASEATGGSPAYARQPLTWGTPAAGAVTAPDVVIDVPAGTYTHLGLWDSVSGGVFKGGDNLRDSSGNILAGGLVFEAQGTITLSDSVTA